MKCTQSNSWRLKLHHSCEFSTFVVFQYFYHFNNWFIHIWAKIVEKSRFHLLLMRKPIEFNWETIHITLFQNVNNFNSTTTCNTDDWWNVTKQLKCVVFCFVMKYVKMEFHNLTFCGLSNWSANCLALLLNNIFSYRKLAFCAFLNVLIMFQSIVWKTTTQQVTQPKIKRSGNLMWLNGKSRVN